jgi:hypothetical protein
MNGANLLSSSTHVTSLSQSDAQRFAVAWIAAWNSHDLDRILSFYDGSVRFSSPTLNTLLPSTHGELQGVSALRAYWQQALSLKPDLHFELIRVMVGIRRCVVHYRSNVSPYCAETFEFNRRGRVVASHAHVETSK